MRSAFNLSGAPVSLAAEPVASVPGSRVERGVVLHHYADGRRVGVEEALALVLMPRRCERAVPVERAAEAGDVQPLREDELQAFAKVFAMEFGFDEGLAGMQMAGWYRDRVGEDVCSVAMSIRLRWATMVRCRRATCDEEQAMALQEQREAWWVRHSGNLDGFATFFLLLVVFVVGCWLSGPDDAQPDEVASPATMQVSGPAVTGRL